jgi:hypothetical protein
VPVNLILPVYKFMKEVKSDKELRYESLVQLVEQRFNSQAVWQGLAWDGEWEPLVSTHTQFTIIYYYRGL